MRRTGIHASWYTLGDLLLLGLAAFFASQVAARLLWPAATPAGDGHAGGAGAPRAAPSATPSGPVLDEVADAVVARNLFNSRTVTPEGEPGSGSAPVSAAPLPVQLLGTVVDSGGGRSLAILDDTEARKQVVLLVGESIRPGAILASVSRNRVVFLRDGREEALEKVRDAAPSRPAAPGAQASRSAPPGLPVDRGGGAEGEPAVGVRRTGENQYVVDRREIEGAMGNLSQLAAQVRLVPNFSEGKADGFRIFNIRPNSLFSKLGVANGDVLRRVNGLEISGAEQALQAFTQLKEASSINLDISRANRNLTLQFEVR
jgi:general secretion pathway protein C